MKVTSSSIKPQNRMQQLKQVTETKCVINYHLTSGFPLPPGYVKPVTKMKQGLKGNKKINKK